MFQQFVTILSPLLLLALVSGVSALRCYQCGQYTDGVGSITPCINYTARQHLKECPPDLSEHCIKYVTEGSIVRDCAKGCTEKTSTGLGESWGTKTFCCKEDGCNSGSKLQPALLALVLVAARPLLF